MKARKIHKVIYSEIFPPSLIALAVLTFVVFTREFGRLTELLIRKSADAFTVLSVVLALLPSILIFTVPFAFLIGTLIGFSRLSADSEVVAMRAGGVSIYQMLWPVCKVNFAVAATTFLLTFVLLPEGNWTLRQIQHQVGLRPVQSEVKPRVFNEDLPQVILYVEDQELQSSAWKGVFLSDRGDSGEKRIILSSKAYPLFSSDAQRLQLHFEEGWVYTVDSESPEKDTLTRFQTLDIPVNFPAAQQIEASWKKYREKNFYELWGGLEGADPEIRRRSSIELQRRIALPLSALIFAVLGVTLGAHTPRGVRGYGFIVSMMIAFLYYILFASGTELAENGDLAVGWGVWGANLVLGVLALLTLRYSQIASDVLTAIPNLGLLVRISRYTGRAIEAFRNLFRGFFRRVRNWSTSMGKIRLRLARVIDLYVTRTFMLYFLLTLAVCVSLFYLFTFFELIDDVFENSVPQILFLDYFFYLFPHVLMLLVPISMLIATLVTFGLLDKTNQVLALKSCGVSVFQIAIPILVLALTVSAFVFVAQEYVLPYANQRQDNLRNLIKGRPVQTYYQGGHSWIFGEENRLYNYSNFDSERGTFAELSIYQLDIGKNRLYEHTYARRAVWNAFDESWQLYDGWERAFKDNKLEYATFEEKASSMSEDPGYFEAEVKESSKMTYLELKDYIESLQQGGFEVDHLKTELYTKLSFPIVSFIMPILGIPFAFSIGRKGALYGIAAGVLLGIFYWGAFGVFGVLGSNGLLSPMLAAWGPNLLFGAAGALLFSAVRT
jgi:LPS export ABC transporter permease LptG/LPS export ABC transporter permease LptF